MRLIDLSCEIHHRMPTYPSHPTVTINPFQDHSTVREDEGYAFSSRHLFLTLGDHAGTHVDAPVHFDAKEGAATIDQVPLETFYTRGICLDLTGVPLASDVTIEQLEAAEARSGTRIEPKDTVLLNMAHRRRTQGTPAFLTEFPGLTRSSAEWLGRKGITAFGVEAISPGRPGINNFQVHHACRDLGFTHYEGLANLDEVTGIGPFTFIAFPLRIRGGTGSPVRAVAVIED